MTNFYSSEILTELFSIGLQVKWILLLEMPQNMAEYSAEPIWQQLVYLIDKKEIKQAGYILNSRSWAKKKKKK